MLARNFSRGPAWLKSQIVRIKRPLSYLVRLCDSRAVRRHEDHLKKCPPDKDVIDDSVPIVSTDPDSAAIVPNTPPTPDVVPSRVSTQPDIDSPQPSPPESSFPTISHQSGRIRHPSDHNTPNCGREKIVMFAASLTGHNST